ncbi:lytic transglycosylase domain-containing protein [Mesorhizobium sp. WSM2239]|uniref:Lytic transglycosylase domain-containing protein n=2 Tax=unclassified Mesorhizobium TaxID=325217 RepID=A0AAU8D6C8_9HYPH
MPFDWPTRFVLAGVLATIGPVAALAQSGELPFAPIPQPRPQAAIEKNFGPGASKASVAIRPDVFVGRDGLDAGVAKLDSGLEALSDGEINQAREVRDSLPERSLDRYVLTWAIAVKGGGLAPTSDIAAAQALPDWPGTAALRRNGERALLREKPDPKAIVRMLSDTPPETSAGVIILARSHIALGDREAARAVLSPLWRMEKLAPKDEAAIIREFGGIIPAADHRARMERMLYAERVNSAKRVAALAGAQSLADAWTAVIRGDRNAGKLLDKVPADQRSAGWFFAKAKSLRRGGKFTEAAEVMLKAPTDGAVLADADAWWVERRVLSRELVDLGDMKTAYRIAAAHAAESPANVADAEFHAGWYAFRGLADARTGARHFSRIAEIAEGPISLSRAYYWLGRAAEAGAEGDARTYFERASVYSTTFYGQLAAQRIGRDRVEVGYPRPSMADHERFVSREPVRAIKRLQAAGYDSLADTLCRELAAELTSPGELTLLAVMAENRGDHYLALKVGKIASSRGIDIGSLSHPMGVIPSSANISGSGKALAYAIARQESEFNIAAVSGAGARGLLQLLPGTAKEVAKKAGITYSKARLTTDPGYNATLGAAFLGEQLGRFDGSYVLTFAGYNAGPRRARDWIKRYGDPRGKDIDTVVDWIESIPFTETRSYVQRVMENYQVYKMRLSGKFDIVGDLINGR